MLSKETVEAATFALVTGGFLGLAWAISELVLKDHLNRGFLMVAIGAFALGFAVQSIKHDISS